MSKRKNIAAAIALVVLMAPGLVSAQSLNASAIQAQINALMLQLQQLQQLQAAAQGSSNAAANISTGAPTPVVPSVQVSVITSGLCATVSPVYGGQTFNVSAGTFQIGSQVYNVPSTVGGTVGTNGDVLDVYAVPRSGGQGVLAFALKGTATDVSDRSQGPLVATLTAGVGGVISAITSYAPGCANYPPVVSVQVPSLTVVADSADPVGGDIVMGTRSNYLFVFDLVNTSAEPVSVTSFTVFDKTAANNGEPFQNLYATNGNVLLARAGMPGQVGNGGTAPNPPYPGGYSYVFSPINSTSITIPAGQTFPITIVGDVASWTSGASRDNGVHTFEIDQPQYVTAHGANSGATANIIAKAYGPNWAVLRSVMTVSTAPLGGGTHTSLNPIGFDPIGTITLTANSAGDVQPGRVTVKFGGNVVNASMLGNVALTDQNGGNVVNASEAIESYDASVNTVTWTFNPTFTNVPMQRYVIAAGSSATFRLSVDYTRFTKLAPDVVPVLTALVSDATYTDASGDNGTSGLTVERLPMQINTVKYAPQTSTVSLSIQKVSGIKSVYQAGQAINFTLTGVQLPSEVLADSASGFNVQSYIYNSNRSATISGVNGSYNPQTGLWSVAMTAPAAAGTYNLDSTLYCAGGSCSSQFTNGSTQVTTSTTFTVPAATSTTPTITVTSPTAGQTLNDAGGKGSLATIKWTSTGLASYTMSIQLYDQNKAYVKTIAASAPNTGSYTWAYDPTLPNGSYTIAVLANVGHPEPPEGDSGLFKVTGSPVGTPTNPVITVTSPSTGAGFTEGIPMTVTWNASGFTPKNIQVSITNAQVGSPVILGTLGASTQTTYTAMIPTTLAPDTRYTVTVCDLGTTAGGSSSVSGGNAPVICGQSGMISIAPAVGLVASPSFLGGSQAPGTTNVEMGQYIMSIPKYEAVNLRTISVNAGAHASMFKNVRVYVNSTQLGSMQSSLSDNGAYTFSGNMTLPAASNATIDITGDITSSAKPGTSNTTNMSGGCFGIGKNSSAAYACQGSVNGQTITIASPILTTSTPVVPIHPVGPAPVTGVSGSASAGLQGDQTAIISQTLQNMLNELNALLKSL